MASVPDPVELVSPLNLPADVPLPHAWPEVDGAILLGYRGSHVHGTYIDPATDAEFGTDDIDLMAVVVPGPLHYLGLDVYGNQGTLELVDGPWDVVAYEARKFADLLCKGNPNVLSLLWAPDEALLVRTPAGDMLREHRTYFTHTRLTATAFHGYVEQQLQAMRRSPTAGAYMGTRRRELAERFGYDVKAASHCIRLARMLVELLRTGQLNVVRPDAQELVAIKRGEWPLEGVLAELEALLGQARDLEDRPAQDWPDRADRGWASDLCAHAVRAALASEEPT